MKAKIQKVLLGVSILDFAAGAILAVCLAFGRASDRTWTGAGILLVTGAWGILWLLCARAVESREVRP